MKTFLSIALLLVGSTATLSAFGGKTWNEGKEHILKRITTRGWISLVCLAVALILGAKKEIITKQEEDKKGTDAAREKAEAVAGAEKRQEILENQLAIAKIAQDSANTRLVDLNRIANLSQGRLRDAQSTLNNVRGNLNDTRHALIQQGSVNLMTELANADEKDLTIEVIVPFTEKANEADTFHGILLPPTLPKNCGFGGFVPASLIFNGREQQSEIYRLDDDKDSHEYFENPTSMVDRLIHPGDKTSFATNEDNWLELVGQHSYNDRIFIAELHPKVGTVSAAELINGLLTSRHPTPLAFFINAELDEHVSEQCIDNVTRYYRVAFERAYYGIILKKKQNFRIYFKLKALPPGIFGDVLMQPFGLDSDPLVLVRGAVTDFLEVKWPPEKK